MNVVIDTNCLLVSISPFSKYHWLFQLIINEKLTVHVTTEILAEYSEIIGKKYNENVSNQVIQTLLELPNVKPVHIHYQFNLIYSDPDDNKFVDCTIASNADYLVSNDKHLNVLKEIPFPKVNLVKLEEFEALVKGVPY